jgi:hypothetical protein
MASYLGHFVVDALVRDGRFSGVVVQRVVQRCHRCCQRDEEEQGEHDFGGFFAESKVKVFAGFFWEEKKKTQIDLGIAKRKRKEK